MINGVILIVAAVLFVVVYLSTDMGMIWLWVAGVYFACGLGNLAMYAIKSRHQLRTAKKQAEKTVKEAEKTAKEAEKKALLAKQTVKPTEQKADIPLLAATEESKQNS